MRIVILSDLHIGKWGDYGENLLRAAENTEGDVLWFNGDIFEPETGINIDTYLERISKLIGKQYKHVVWVMGNNCIEIPELVNPTFSIEDYAEIASYRLDDFGIVSLDMDPHIVGDYALVGSTGWFNGDLWEPCRGESDQPNTAEDCKKAAEKFFEDTFQERWSSNVEDMFLDDQAHLRHSIGVAKHFNKKIILGTHYVTSKKFCLYGSSPRYDYLNWYMGFDGSDIYELAQPELAFVGHTHRRKRVMVGETEVHNVSGAKELVVFDL